MFAESFCEFHEKISHTYMMLEAYHCPVVKKPVNVGGYLRLATEDYITIIAEFMAGFSEDAFGRPVQPETMLPVAKEAASSGRFADAKNPVSNKVYQSIGFLDAGRIADIKFDLRP
ncbi:hypothetical protein UQ64_09680 [Paenibacillus etheri]|uniref:Uncharacterized protein n=1 Tax=Paenibacillus etheri TaxID=1306852 RepID=A0A0W1B0R3_9BACL|nr:hypothetical protein UQ64_09680 [Paenibacillus etheri]